MSEVRFPSDLACFVMFVFLQSLTSRGFVKEQYAWRHFYWYLTNEGIQYLRDYLHLPPEIVPTTLKRQARPEMRAPLPTRGRLRLSLYWQLVEGR